MNEAEYRAENAEGRGVAGRRFQHVSRLFGLRFTGQAVGFEQPAHLLDPEAVSGQLDRQRHERVVHCTDLRLERANTLAAGTHRVFGQTRHQLLLRFWHLVERVAHRADGGTHHVQRERHQQRGQCSPEHDQRRGRLHQRAQRPAFQQLRADDNGDGERNAHHGRDVTSARGGTHRMPLRDVPLPLAVHAMRSATSMKADSGAGNRRDPTASISFCTKSRSSSVSTVSRRPGRRRWPGAIAASAKKSGERFISNVTCSRSAASPASSAARKSASPRIASTAPPYGRPYSTT